MQTRSELINLALSEGFDLEEAEALTNEELADMYDDEEEVVQDQGSLDEPIKEEVPEEVASDLGTEELRERAREIVEGVNLKRDPFPWEAPPPKRK